MTPKPTSHPLLAAEGETPGASPWPWSSETGSISSSGLHIPGKGVTNVTQPVIFCYENWDVLRGLNTESVDLVYLDPPFQTGKQYHAPVGTTAEGASFSDIWHEDSVKEWQHIQLAETHPGLYRYIDAVDGVGRRSDKWYLVFMAVRLIEIHRILKSTGSVFLHCDPTANSYLRLAMDAIFGRDNFANEIVWAYSGPHASKSRYSGKHDTLLFYRKHQKEAKFNPQFGEIRPKTLATYNQVDEEGRHYKRLPGSNDLGIEIRQYLDEHPGRRISSWWDDIPSFSSARTSKERLGYPTQKPLKLLERVIRSTTDEGDLVLDPFAGCATACEAADNLDRRWIGVDVSKKAYELIQYRLERRAKAHQLPFDGSRVFYADAPPVRTDLGYIRPLTGQWKTEVRSLLYGQQSGNCAACGIHQEIPSNLHIDHIHPKSKGGSDHLANLQLLCPRCNSLKGDRPMDYLDQRITRRKEARHL